MTVVAALFLAGCAGGSDSNDKNDKGDPASAKTNLTVASAQEPQSWDYVTVPATSINQLLAYNVIEPLLERGSDGSLSPLLAESYDVSADALTYTFKIRKADFQNGQPLTSADVVYSLDLYKAAEANPGLAAPFASVDSIEATDDRTVTVTLSKPSRAFLEGMAELSGLIIPKDSAESLAKQPVGTGPFTFASYKPGVDVKLSRFDGYWGDAPALKSVDWRFIADPTAITNALKAGEADLAPSTQRDAVAGFASSGFTVTPVSSTELGYMALSAKDPAFQDERVRQAIAYAINRDDFTSLNKYFMRTCVFANPASVAWNSDYCPYEYDPDKAKALLQEAGAGSLSLELEHITGSYGDWADIVRSQLSAVGVDVKTKGMEVTKYLDDVFTKSAFHVTVISGPQQADNFTCPGWWVGYCDKEFDSLLERADATTDANEWADLRRQAIERLADDAYVIPLFNVSLVGVSRPGLEGVKDYAAASEVDLRHLSWSS